MLYRILFQIWHKKEYIIISRVISYPMGPVYIKTLYILIIGKSSFIHPLQMRKNAM